MAAMSRCIVTWSEAWRSAAAGWYIAKPEAARAPVAGSTGRSVPWTRLMVSPGMNAWRLKRPSVTTSAGSRTSSWRRRKGRQAAISSGSGSRLPGGRHFTTFVMKTSSRCQPTSPSSSSSRVPAAPTKGRPSRSSFWPGPSPTKTTSVSGWPSPGTACVRLRESRQRSQTRTSLAMASSAALRSSVVTRPRRRGGRPPPASRCERGPRRSPPRWWPRPCAGCPRRPRRPGRGRPAMEASWRMRPTKTSSRPAASVASG